MTMPFAALRFDNTFTRELPADPERENRPRPVQHAAFTRVLPTRVAAPTLLAHSREVAELLELTPADLASAELPEVFAGNLTLPGMDPYAACYGGHQFGNWAGQLGDGRAISLGEVVNTRGERWELQLKGAGPTPYSRHADGRAVLRSSLREFLCSEAMHHLGVPTTRALCLIGTGEKVVRDILYDGNPRPEPGAIVCRVAPSFLRFGNFELPASRNDVQLLERLTNYCLRHHYPELPLNREGYARFLEILSARTATMVAHWQRVGFVHGVMNTDNMSALGLTIDYGPYGFLDDFDPNWTPNTTDAGGRRYRYQNQPRVALWNLLQLANALHALVGEAEPLESALAAFGATFDEVQTRSLSQKLGIRALQLQDEASPDYTLVGDLMALLSAAETDFTIFYRKLAQVPSDDPTDQALLAPLLPAYYESPSEELRTRTIAWLRRYLARVREDGTPDGERRQQMDRVNPKYVLRNYLAQEAIDAAEKGDTFMIADLLECLRRPYDEQPQHERYAEKRPDWARHRAGCSMLSCSS